jgi:putative ATPase
MVGQEHLLKQGSVFRNALNNKKVPNMIFYGPPGTGKTTIANIIAKQSNLTLYKLNGTNASTDDIKKVIGEIDSLLNTNGILLYLDEIQYLNKKQQQSLLEFVESGDITLIASTTENPYFYIYPALISRCVVFEFKSISSKDIEKGILRACKSLDIRITDEACNKLAQASNGDMRKCLNNLEFLTSSLEENTITLEKVDELIDKANIVYDRGEDKHFDNLSAFMKSLRGSDPDAAIYYLAQLLVQGDFKALDRRLIACVYEDVGLANPQLCSRVVLAVQAAEIVGFPENKQIYADLAIEICLSPKSNSGIMAIYQALHDIENGKIFPIPNHIKDNNYKSSVKLGHNGKSSKTKKALFILIAIVGLIVIAISNGLLIYNELNINSDKIEKIENLKKQ